MAELLVQKKKRSVWPWVLVALLIAALVAFMLLRNDTPATNDSIPGESTNRTTSAPTGTGTRP